MPDEAATRSPTLSGFRLAYCDQLVEFMGRGYSLTAFAGEIGVSRATLDRWVADHPTFARAVERGKARRARVLEDRLLGADGKEAFGLHMEALKAAAPHDWRREPEEKARPPAVAAPLAQIALPDNGRG
jgi:hypothetical protein